MATLVRMRKRHSSPAYPGLPAHPKARHAAVLGTGKSQRHIVHFAWYANGRRLRGPLIVKVTSAHQRWEWENIESGSVSSISGIWRAFLNEVRTPALTSMISSSKHEGDSIDRCSFGELSAARTGSVLRTGELHSPSLDEIARSYTLMTPSVSANRSSLSASSSFLGCSRTTTEDPSMRIHTWSGGMYSDSSRAFGLFHS